MGFRINTNIGAMNAHSAATMNNRELDNSLSRLSSGLRINKAADDASGMVIADSLRAQSKGLGQAISNANDGIAVTQTADGALDEYSNIIQTVRTKAIQASSDGQNSDSRAAIQRDINKLLEVAEKIATTTSFNGQKLLDGNFTNKAFQVGAYAGETVGVSIGNVKTNAVGGVTSMTGTSTRADFVNATDLSESSKGYGLAAKALTINGTDISSSLNTLSPTRLTDAASVAAAITNATGLVTGASNTFTATGAIAGGNIAANSLKINGVAIAATTVLAADADGALLRAINDISDQTGVTASLDANKKLVLDSADGSNISITTSTATLAVSQVDTATLTGAITAGSITATVNGTALSPTPFTTNHVTTMTNLATAIDTALGGDASVVYTAAKNTTVAGTTSDATSLAAGQTLSWTDKTPGGSTYSYTAGASNEDLDTAMAGLQGIINGISVNSNYGATYDSGTNTLVITDKATGTVPAGTFSVTGTSTATFGTSSLAADSLVATGKTDGTAFTLSLNSSNATGLVASSAVTTVGVAAITVGNDTVTGLTADNLTSVDSSVVAGLTSSNAAPLVIAKGDLVINGVDMAGTYGDGTTLGGARAALETSIKAISGLGDSSINALGVIKLIANDGQDLNIAGVTANSVFNLAKGVTNQSAEGTVEIFSKEVVAVGGEAETSFGLTEGTSKVKVNGSSLSSIDVTSRNSAQVSILIADSALQAVNTVRSNLGSVQNQLESTIRNISVTQVNVSSAESQIRDVDFAAESANFSKRNILAQSGSYAMSQANAVQQNVLRLLQ